MNSTGMCHKVVWTIHVIPSGTPDTSQSGQTEATLKTCKKSNFDQNRLKLET